MTSFDGHDDNARSDGPEGRSEESQLLESLLETQRKTQSELHDMRQALYNLLTEVASLRKPVDPEPVKGERLRSDLALDRVHRLITLYERDGRARYTNPLGPSQADVLGYLVDARGQTRHVRVIAGAVGVSDHSVRKIIGQLRLLCEDDNWTLIRTIRGKGYAVCVSG